MVAAPRNSSMGLKSRYLVLYNVISACAWGALLVRVAALLYLGGYKNVHAHVSKFAKWTQTGALLEVLHIAFGLVRSPLITTVIQVASRILLVWGIVHPFPESTAISPAYSSMLIAWSVTEVIRYSYYALNLLGGVPKALTWLRYNTFFILYPLGAGSEAWLVKRSLGQADAWNPMYGYLLRAILVIYVPGFYTMFTHMIGQRRKVMKQMRAKKQ
ncbi:hypothetical protein YB2330_000505 [Saitoella coloradoensis]